MPEFSVPAAMHIDGLPVNVTLDATVDAAILNNTPPGPSQTVTVETKQIGIPSDKPIKFELPGSASVSFHASANAAIMIAPTPKDLAQKVNAGLPKPTDPGAATKINAGLPAPDEKEKTDLDPMQQIVSGIKFPEVLGTHYGLLRWGYDLGVSATSGSIALAGGVTATFGMDAGRSGVYALVRQYNDVKINKCGDIVEDLFANWCIPSKVKDYKDIPEASWVIVETNGSLSWTAKVSYGYNLNWIKQETAGTLSGKIGEKLQVGLAANVGFSTSAKHAMVLSRDTGAQAQIVRMQLFKLKLHQVDAGVSASVTVKAETGLLPGNIGDLIAGVIGTSGGTVVGELIKVGQWTNTAKPPTTGPLANVSEQYATDFLATVTGENVAAGFQVVQRQMQALDMAWSALPQVARQTIWPYLTQSADVDAIQRLAAEIVGVGAGVAALLESKLTDMGYICGPEGRVLESLTSRGLFWALQDSGKEELGKIIKGAENIQAILSNAALRSLLVNLAIETSKRLDWKKLNAKANEAEVNSLDEMFKAKLAAFLGTATATKPQNLAPGQVQELAKQLGRLDAKGQKFYDAALKALQHGYGASLTATYQRGDTRTALADVTLDFGKNATNAQRCLANMMQGKFDDVFSAQNSEGITLNQGLLTHELKRTSTVELTLPFFSEKNTHVNDVLSKIDEVDHGQGRLLTVQAKDEVKHEVSVAKARFTRDSSLSLTMSLYLDGKTGDGVQVHDEPTATSTYELSDTFKGMKPTVFQEQYKPEVAEYFRDAFGGVTKYGFGKWTSGLAEANKGMVPGPVSLEVALAPTAVNAWKQAPADARDHRYKEMAATVVARYREMLLRQYFADTSRYGLVGSTADPTPAILAYACTPICYHAMLDQNEDSKPIVTTADPEHPDDKSAQLYWDWADKGLRHAMLGSPATRDALALRMKQISDELKASGDPNEKWYGPDQLSYMQGYALGNQFADLLFRTENIIVNNARDAAMYLAAFLKGTGSQHDRIHRLEKFASELTEAFGADMRSWATGAQLLPMGPALLETAASVFAAADSSQRSAMFTVGPLETSPGQSPKARRLLAAMTGEAPLGSGAVTAPPPAAKGAAGGR